MPDTIPSALAQLEPAERQKLIDALKNDADNKEKARRALEDDLKAAKDEAAIADLKAKLDAARVEEDAAKKKLKAAGGPVPCTCDPRDPLCGC